MKRFIALLRQDPIAFLLIVIASSILLGLIIGCIAWWIWGRPGFMVAFPVVTFASMMGMSWFLGRGK